ncbi:MAG TPA: TetR/AcrR family transcriptional regulator [Myxococcota bacterium]|nr:TetR/AcrR family transcriptional regulator [Myxococcota bacterium]
MPERPESPRLRVPRRAARERRSRAERSAETRARILDAVVASIAEVGLPRTTASEIARRAGVTWGAVQHHFGDKDELLAAVLEDGFARFADRFEDLAAGGSTLDARAAAFVDRAWEHFASPLYRANFEILLGTVREARSERTDRIPAEMLAAVDELWTRTFPDSPLARERRHALERYVIAVLSGLATQVMLQGPSPRVLPDVEIAVLKDTLARELAGPKGGGPAASG